MLRIIVVLITAALVAGCSYMPRLDEVLPDRRSEYRKSESLPDLEVPPDLTTDTIQDTMAVPDVNSEGTATFSTYQERIDARREAREATNADAASIQALADEKVVVVKGSPATVWDQVRSYFSELGYTLDLDDSELGVLETDWLENKSGQTRDKFKVFAEAGQEPGTTVLYVSHTGEEMSADGGSWHERPRDAALETAMAQRLQAYLEGSSTGSDALAATGTEGAEPQPEAENTEPAASADDLGPIAAEEARASQAIEGDSELGDSAPVAAADETSAGQGTELVNAGDGKLYLRMPEDFAVAWRNMGAALDQAGMQVEEADRTRGIYHIRYEPAGSTTEDSGKKKGILSKLAFWKDDGAQQYQLSLTGVGNKTEVVVLDAEGKWETGGIANDILTTLKTHLNKLS